MSLIDKIDAEIEKLWKDDDGRGSNTVPIIVLGLERAKEIILSEQSGSDINVATKTIEDIEEVFNRR